ncbi:aa3-type cytochrome c oxidase subunit IV [Terrarubrum flagellatum]|uniref:aa3-type cytochrome c oxidase subunit IV n=1 Tax=Terrirubrum flagellatum TaxID=2895980 RepID=UPI0031455A70
MADHGQAQTADGHPDMDYAEHESTYNGFLVFVKWGIIVNCAILIGMAVFLL